MIKYLQINLRKSGSARQIMDQTLRELGSEILILSEIPRSPPDTDVLVSSQDAKCSIALSPVANFAAISSGRGVGFAYMQFPGLLVYSCYIRTGGPVAEFGGKCLAGLEENIRTRYVLDSALVVAGDFNAKSPSWGSGILDARGAIIENFAVGLEL